MTGILTSDPQASETAVIDRFEADVAVLLVGTPQRPLNVPRAQLPPDVQAGQWLRVQLDGDRLFRVDVDPEATDAARQRIEAKLAQLKRGDHLI